PPPTTLGATLGCSTAPELDFGPSTGQGCSAVPVCESWIPCSPFAAQEEKSVSTLHVPAHAAFDSVLGRAASRAPEAFADGRLRNLSEGSWNDNGEPSMMITPVDGSSTIALAKVSADVAEAAVDAAVAAHTTWSAVPLAERRARVTAAVAALADARDDLALLLGWEIGKPWRLACADVDRALDGVRWYLKEIEQMMSVDVHGQPYERQPLPGPVSNIASWNYPMSV